MNENNKVRLIGRVAEDAERKQTQNGKPFVRFRMATDRSFGEKKFTDWHKVTVWGAKATDLRKGEEVCVEGQYVTNSWEDRNTGQRRFEQQVNAFSLKVWPRTPEGMVSPNEGQQSQAQQPQAGYEDDIPW